MTQKNKQVHAKEPETKEKSKTLGIEVKKKLNNTNDNWSRESVNIQQYYQINSTLNFHLDIIKNMKKVFLVLLLITFTFTQQSFSFDSIPGIGANPSIPTELPNCAETQGGKCKKCDDGYEPDSTGQCQKISVDSDFIPCDGQPNCGESRPASKQKIQELIRNKPTQIQKQVIGALPGFIAPQPGNNDHQETNNQQQGVDQADLLKNDGTYIYTVSGHSLNIILAYPIGQAQKVSHITLQVQPTALFIEGNYLALFGTITKNGDTFTYVLIFNIYNRANPYLVRQYHFEGSYFDGRKTRDGYVYLLNSKPVVARPNLPLTPWYNVGNGRTYLNYFDVFVYIGNYINPLFVNIISFDLRNPNPSRTEIKTVVTETVHKIYMSWSHIYFTFTDIDNGLDYTVIHKVFVWKTYIIPFADQKLRGSIRNQFSLDEFSGFILRVTTTNVNDPVSSISVYCLNYFLQVFGQTLNFGQGRKVFATRYVGRRVYIGTDSDPLIVVGFPSHYLPFPLGSLSLSGFSRYIHPYDENRILIFGRSDNANTGLKVWLIDATNPFSPNQLGSFELTDALTGSTAEFQHKAFLFMRSLNLMILPLRLFPSKFNGVLHLKIVPSAIPGGTWIFQPNAINHFSDAPGESFGSRSVQRSTRIEEMLYTKSKCLLKINEIGNLANQKNINLVCA